MMKELESGREEHKRFSLADEYFPAPILKVLQMAAAIPIGCVTSYGNIAKLAGTDPRVVGQIMANNPLYPIVPCHRVVGSDFSLVGYGGRKSHHALQAKLTRLSREAKGFTTRTEIPVNGKSLTVYPVEHVHPEGSAASAQSLSTAKTVRALNVPRTVTPMRPQSKIKPFQTRWYQLGSGDARLQL